MVTVIKLFTDGCGQAFASANKRKPPPGSAWGRASHAHLETVSCLVPRSAHLHGFDHSLPQVLRNRTSAPPTPEKENRYRENPPISKPVGIPQFNSSGNRSWCPCLGLFGLSMRGYAVLNNLPYERFSIASSDAHRRSRRQRRSTPRRALRERLAFFLIAQRKFVRSRMRPRSVR